MTGSEVGRQRYVTPLSLLPLPHPLHGWILSRSIRKPSQAWSGGKYSGVDNKAGDYISTSR